MACESYYRSLTRRDFFGQSARGLGVAALASLLGESLRGDTHAALAVDKLLPHFAPKAKRVIYLFMLGAPSQLDLLDYKPALDKLFDTDLPDSVRKGQRLTGMTSGQARFPVAPSKFKFSQHGQGGTWFSELLPWTAKMADDLCVIKTMHTEAINHEPANTLINTGNMNAGRPCIGSWLSYGLGSMNENLPAFVVLHAQHSNPNSNVQAISARLWSSGPLPSQHSGVAIRPSGGGIQFLDDPPGLDRATRRRMLDSLAELNHQQADTCLDPETLTRIAQYEMAFRMQASVPELTDLSKESEQIRALYGPDVKKPGSFAHCALLARRMAERGVRFIQIYHRGWDQHGTLPAHITSQCLDVDQASYALVQDLKARGLLDDTLVVWGGEFGRTVYSQGTLTRDDYGRDHHPKNFSIWMAGGGVKGGMTYGETDDFSYNIVKDPVHIRDFHATMLNLLGIDHERMSIRSQGLDMRLTGVEPSKIIKDILA
ncbi:MAG: DUF1501 domain-containing protein [Verrucomicrobiota bacterium]